MNTAKNFDYDLIKDFRDVFIEKNEDIQRILIDLEHRSKSEKSITRLQCLLDTVFNDLQTLNMHVEAGLVQALLGLISQERLRLRFDPRLTDVVLLVNYKIRDLFETIFSRKHVLYDNVDQVITAINRIGNAHSYVEDCNKVLELLDPRDKRKTQHAAVLSDDMDFFKQFAHVVEGRCSYNIGTSNRIASFANSLNRLAGSPVAANQLRVAALIHDIGMAFLAVDVHRSVALNDQERLIVQTHPQLGMHFLNRFTGWDDAAMMVLHHHERQDGTGYPDGIDGDEIHPGAKILAIADTFEAMSHERTHRSYKRPLVRVIAEINSNAHSQFDPYWVGVFNRYIRNSYQ